MNENPGRCVLCGEEAGLGPARAPSGGIRAAFLVSCGKCRASYLVPKTTDLKKLEALSPAQKTWIAAEARKQFEVDPSSPFVVNEGAILMAKQRAK